MLGIGVVSAFVEAAVEEVPCEREFVLVLRVFAVLPFAVLPPEVLLVLLAWRVVPAVSEEMLQYGWEPQLQERPLAALA